MSQIHVLAKDKSYHSINSSLQECELADARSPDFPSEARNLHFYLKSSDI